MRRAPSLRSACRDAALFHQRLPGTYRLLPGWPHFEPFDPGTDVREILDAEPRRFSQREGRRQREVGDAEPIDDPLLAGESGIENAEQLGDRFELARDRGLVSLA